MRGPGDWRPCVAEFYAHTSVRGSLSAFQRGKKLFGGERVYDIAFRQPAAPGLKYAVFELLEMRGVMSIGVDGDLYASFASHAEMTVVEIKPVWVGVQFHCDFVLRREVENSVHVELISVTTQ